MVLCKYALPWVIPMAGVAGVAIRSTVEADAHSPVSFLDSVPQAPKPELLTADELTQLRGETDQFQSVFSTCARQIGYEAHPVANLSLANHYTPTGDDGNNGSALGPDSQAAYKQALCYLLNGNTTSAGTAQRILDAWASTLKTVSGTQAADDVSFYVPYMAIAANWVDTVNGWSAKSFGTFCRTVAEPASTASDPNNHGAWGVFLDSTIAVLNGNATLLTSARNRWSSLLQGAIVPNGPLVHEYTRSSTSNYNGGPTKGQKGLDYTHYFLYPASAAAKIFATNGQPMWQTDAGKLLQSAFNQAAAWTLNPSTFPFYASNNGTLIGVRNAGYFALLLRQYPNQDAENVLDQGGIGADGLDLTGLFGYPNATRAPAA